MRASRGVALVEVEERLELERGLADGDPLLERHEVELVPAPVAAGEAVPDVFREVRVEGALRVAQVHRARPDELRVVAAQVVESVELEEHLLERDPFADLGEVDPVGHGGFLLFLLRRSAVMFASIK